MLRCPLRRLGIRARTRLRAIGRMVRNKGRLSHIALGLLAELCILHCCICVVVGGSLLTWLNLRLRLRLRLRLGCHNRCVRMSLCLRLDLRLRLLSIARPG